MPNVRGRRQIYRSIQAMASLLGNMPLVFWYYPFLVHDI
jgi:hypothetical protein